MLLLDIFIEESTFVALNSTKQSRVQGRVQNIYSKKHSDNNQIIYEKVKQTTWSKSLF